MSTKKTLIISLLLLTSFSGWSQACLPPTLGDGVAFIRTFGTEPGTTVFEVGQQYTFFVALLVRDEDFELPEVDSYEWRLDGVSLPSDGTRALMLVIPPLADGEHTLEAIPLNDCGESNENEAPVTRIIDINNPCEADVMLVRSAGGTICADGATSHSFVMQNTTDTFTWQVDNGGVITPSATQAGVIFVNSGNHTITATNTANAGCIYTISVNAESGPDNITSVEGVNAACELNTLQYTVIGADKANSFSWSLPAGISANYLDTQQREAELTFNSQGIFNIGITPANDCGLGAQFDLVINVEENLIVNRNIEFNHTQLQASPTDELILNTCDQRTSDCRAELDIVELRIALDLGDEYQWGEADFSASVDFTVVGTGIAGDLLTRSESISISTSQPEALFAVELNEDVTSLRKFTIQIDNYTVTGGVDNYVRFSATYDDHYQIDMDQTELSAFGTQVLPGSGWDVKYAWSSSCSLVNAYQLRLLKVFEGETVPSNTSHRWENALIIESESTELIITMAEGSGQYAWQVRPVGNKAGGTNNPENLGEWPNNVQTFVFTQPDEDKNYIYSRTFTEGNRVSEQLTFADGLQRVNQQQTRLNSSDQVVATQTLQDYTGRDAIQSLPAPVVGKSTLGYEPNLMTDGATLYSAESFDSDNKVESPDAAYLDKNAGDSGYYGGADNGINADVADAEGVPYTRSLFMNDGTGRLRRQGGVGAAHGISSPHTVRYFYTGVAQQELDFMFGSEAPVAANTYKELTVDANNTTSVSYQNKDGKTIATALVIGTGNTNLDGLDSRDDATKTITENITEKAPLNESTSSSKKPLVFTLPSGINVNYTLSPTTINDVCNSTCKTCDYVVTFILHDMEDPANTRQLAAYTINADAVNCAANTTYSRSFTESVDAGSYTLEKRVRSLNRSGVTGNLFIDDHLTEVRDHYSGEVAAVFDPVDAYIRGETIDLEGLYAYLDAQAYAKIDAVDGQDGYYEVTVGCDGELIIIPILVDDCDQEVDCSDLTSQDFVQYFMDYWDAEVVRRPRPIGDPDPGEIGDFDGTLTYEWLAFRYRADRGPVYLTKDEFNTMMANMLQELDESSLYLYDCQMVWQVWKQQVQNYEYLKGMTLDPDELPDEADGLTYEYNLIDNFFQTIEIRLKETETPEMPKMIRKEGFYTSVPGDAEKPYLYKLFYYNAADERMNDCMTGYIGYYNSLATTTSPCDQVNVTDQFLCLPYSERQIIYNCIKYGGYNDDDDDPENENLLLMIRQCHDACENKRPAFRQAVIDDIHNQDLYVEGDAFLLEVDPVTGVKRPTGAPRDPAVFDIEQCEIEAMEQALVDNCRGYCLPELEEIIIFEGDSPEDNIVTRKITDASIENIRKVLTADFEVSVSPTGSDVCPAGFDVIENSTLIDIANGTTTENITISPDDFDWAAAAGTPSNPADFDVVYTVTSIADDGSIGTLRWAFEEINANLNFPDKALINFNIPGLGSHVISLTSRLPTLYAKYYITIDGTTQPGWNGQPVIKLVQSQPMTVMIEMSQADNFTVKGLELDISSEGTGIQLIGSNTLIQGNKITCSTNGTCVGVYSGGIGPTIFETQNKVVGNYISGSPTPDNSSNQKALSIFTALDSEIIGNFIENSTVFFSRGGRSIAKDKVFYNNLNPYSFSSNNGFNDLWRSRNLHFPDQSITGFSPYSGEFVVAITFDEPFFDGSKWQITGTSQVLTDVDNIDLYLIDYVSNNNAVVQYLGVSDVEPDGSWSVNDLDIPNGFYLGATYTYEGLALPLRNTTSLLYRGPIVERPLDCDVQPSLCFRFGDPITEITIPEGFEDYVFEATPFTCEELNTQEIVRTLDFQQNEYIAGKVEDFRDDYYTQCADATQVNDDFEVSYDLGYHHYTLYYYDRAGNLMRTVPPIGFNTTDPNDHQMATDYHYNSLGQLVKQNSPDGGETYFYYNDLGQLRFSQNAQQALEGAYSYTKYDNLGRIVEVGESTNGLSTFRSLTNSPGFPQEGTEKTVTVYTEVYAGALTSPQRFLQNRVSYTYLDEDGLDGTLDDRTHTIYSYDPHGNVERLVQRVPGLEDKVIQYNYDLISGNVLMVSYNPSYADQFYHKYDYDEDNRITSVSTSVDGKVWDVDATYEYYPHGPLKTANIGEDNLQQLDYIYTIHGWLKALNNPDANDGTNTFGKDAFAMAVNYYNGDYLNPNTNIGLLTAATGRELFNGNISAWELATHASDDQWVRTGYQYQYDELNRIKDSRFNVYRADAPSTPTFYARGGFHADFNLDANGNLQNLNRNDIDAVNFDALTYNYDLSLSNNRLKGVTDAVLDTEVHPQDLESQSLSNYTYDEIGNLTRDDQEDIDIDWTVYGKVDALTKGGGGGTKFTYDAAGNRVKKETVDAFGKVYSTYYVRDASGNIMGTYRANSGAPELREVPIYGSDRIGVYTPEGAETNNQEAVENIATDGTVNSYDGVSYELEDGVSLTLQPGFKFEDGADGNNFFVTSASATSGALPADVYTRTLDQKQYELKDHLGNVRAVITDRKQSETDSGTPQNFTPKIVSASAYYPYGMDMPTVRWQEFTSTATMEPADILLELPEFDNYAEIAGNPEITISDPVFNHTETYVNQGPTDVPSYSFRLTGETGKIIGLSKSLKVQAGDKITASVFGKYLMPDGSEDPTDIATSLADAFLTTFGITSTQEVATINQFFTDLLGGTLTLTKPDDPSGNNVIAGINCVVFDEDFNFVDAGFQLFTAAAVNDHEELALPEYIVPKDGYVFIYTSNESPQVTQVNFDDLVVTHEKLVPDEAYDSDLIAYRYGFNGKEKDQQGEWGGAAATSGELVSSLVAYLPFDGNANDISGNGLNGTVNGATLIADREGNTNGAYSFDGVDDEITILSQPALNMTQALSVSVWVKAIPHSTGDNAGIVIAKHDGSGNERSWSIGTNAVGSSIGSRMQVTVSANGTNQSNAFKTYYTSIDVFDNTWHHVAFTFDAGTLKLFVDGSEDTNAVKYIDGNISTLHTSTTSVTVGHHYMSGVPSKFLEGDIDDVQIYAQSLDEQQISMLASGQTLGELEALRDAIIASYAFDGNANDISGNGLNGTVNGATLIADREGNTNGAYSFDGTNDYIELTNTQNSMSFIQNTGVFSIVT
ncbi:MAG: LamG-like jellyroll fold domain-containing protein, partial [Bacteroidota bacterium]